MSIELLSPAGGIEQLKAAVQSGADAVYMGGYNFNARHSAKNFTPDEMKQMIEYCHTYGVKVHVTVNTLVKEKEKEALLEYIYELNKIGVDALIVQDIGMASVMKKAIPDMELHASTQMTVTSLEGVQYLEKMGFDRVVLARELSKEEIEYICKNSKAEIEVFVHGAICQCYSGQCLMSSILGGRSGNRGRCAQPCRLKYSLSDGHSGYLLSPKDMALINELAELKRIGVASLKIEGRLKRPEYVSAVTGIYRKYLDHTVKISDTDMKELTEAFSRTGFTDGYFKNKLGASMMSSNNPSNSENHFSAEAKARTNENADFRKVPVSISAYLTKGEPLTVTIYDNDGNCATVSGTIPAEEAKNKPLDCDRLTEQLSKLGGTPYKSESNDIFIDENITIPIKEINNIRRDAVAQLTAQRISVPQKREIEYSFPIIERASQTTMLTASVKTEAQAIAVIESGIKIIYAPIGIAEKLIDKYKDIKIIADTGAIFRPINTKLRNVLVSSNGAYEFYSQKALHGDFRLNVYNSITAEHYSSFDSITLSPELNLGEIRDLAENTTAKLEVIAYGRIPLMIMKNCPLKSASHCQNGKQLYSLKDRKNEEFPILCGRDCIAELLNSKPIFMADKIKDLLKLNLNYIRLNFTIEDKSKCKEICSLYAKALNKEQVKNPFEENHFTRGHFYRGVD